MKRFLAAVLILGCVEQVAPVSVGVSTCNGPSECTSPTTCHRGHCLLPVSRCNHDGIINGAEECDDGNSDSSDACADDCRLAFCGDGVHRKDVVIGAPGYEECDVGTEPAAMYCDAECRIRSAPSRLAAGRGFTCLSRGNALSCWGEMMGYPDIGIRSSETIAERVESIAIMETVAYSGAARQVGSVNLASLVDAAQTGRFPLIFVTSNRASTQAYPWLYFIVGHEVERMGPEQTLAVYPSIGFERARTHRGFFPYRHTDDRAYCWINAARRLRCNRRSDCRGAPNRRDAGRYHGVNLDRLGQLHDVALSSAAACAARISGGRVLCWGDLDGWGRPDRSGCMNSEARRTATAHSETELLGPEWVVALSAGEHHHLGLTDDGVVYEWGWDWRQERVIDPPILHEFIDPVMRIASGHRTRCVLFENGRVGCWGLNRGSLDGAGDELAMVEGLENIVELMDGWQLRHMCARSADDRVFCWGDNDKGQLGDGGGRGSLTPVEIDLPALKHRR